MSVVERTKKFEDLLLDRFLKGKLGLKFWCGRNKPLVGTGLKKPNKHKLFIEFVPQIYGYPCLENNRSAMP